MNWLSLLSVALSNTHVRSLMLGLSGVVGTYLTQWLSGQDFGPSVTPLVAAGLPVLVNAIRKWLTTAPPAALDLQKLDLLGPLTDEQIANLRAGGYEVVLPPPPPPMDMTRLSGGDDVPFSFLWFIPLLWLCCSAAQAAAPKAVINGPQTGTRGEILILDATGCEGEPTHFTWRITPELKARKQLELKDGGRRVQVASYGGSYVVTLTVSNADGNDVVTWPLVIPGDAPCPSPEPQPVTPTPIDPIPVDPAPPRPPAPEPVIPTPSPQPVTPTPPAPSPGRFGIAARVRAAVLGVSSPTRAVEVAGLRSSIEALMTRARSGQLTPQQFLDSLVAELKGLPDSWQVVKTLAALGIRVLVTGGQLKTVEDWVDLAAEILDALSGL